MGRRLCLGCFVMYPSAAISLAILLLINGFLPLNPIYLLIAAFILFGINAVRKVIFRDNFKKGVHFIFRIELGITLALAIMSIILTRGNERLFTVILVLAVAIVYNVYNGKRNLDICKKCPQHAQFPKCEGLAENYEKTSLRQL